MADDKTPNLSDSFQQVLSQWERRFDSIANEVMGTENFSRSMNQMQNMRLSAQQAFRDFMGGHLSNANMPTREDVLNLAEAIHGLDRRVANIESILTTMNASGKGSNERMGPPRTRKPPSAETTGAKKTGAGKSSAEKGGGANE